VLDFSFVRMRLQYKEPRTGTNQTECNNVATKRGWIFSEFSLMIRRTTVIFR
jgi:hypothetical protein